MSLHRQRPVKAENVVGRRVHLGRLPSLMAHGRDFVGGLCEVRRVNADTQAHNLEDVVKSAGQGAVLFQVYCANKRAAARPAGRLNLAPRSHRFYFTTSGMLSLWLLNSGAYMHWISAMPTWYWPRLWMRTEYSKT